MTAMDELRRRAEQESHSYYADTGKRAKKKRGILRKPKALRHLP